MTFDNVQLRFSNLPRPLMRKMLSRRIVSYVKSFKRCSSTEGAAVTALYDFHVRNGGKMVNFGGYLLPVQYNDQGITASHLHTRKSSSLFDVSHMLQTEITGKDAVEFFEKICTADITGLSANSATLTVFTNNEGGILDDLIVTKIESDHLYVVSNAARKEHDQKHILAALEQHKSKNPSTDIKIQFFDPLDRALLALQGPKSVQVLQKLSNRSFHDLYFMNSTIAPVAGVDLCRITRCGYTGEDGFEISLPAIKASDVAEEILKNEEVKLAGLGARDSLRLEAGLCLYGSDITTETTPIEAGLTWLISKARRERKDFPGFETVLKQIREGAVRKRVGLVANSGPPARHGAPIFDEKGQRELGTVTSGCPSPSLEKNIAMGYVPTEFSKNGTKVALKIRDKFYEAVVTKMPFVESNYYSKPK